MLFNRYKRNIHYFLKQLFSRRMLPLIACVAGIIVVFVLVISMGGSGGTVAPEDTALAERSRILVGIVPNGGAMCKAEEDGSFSGYEYALMRTILEELYPNIPVEFTEIDSQIASYQLRNGVIDLAIGTFAKDTTKTQGLSRSAAYYTDGIYAYVPADSSVTMLAELQGRTVYLASTEFPVKLATAGFTELGIELNTVSCSSYPDTFAALSEGRAAALVGPRCKLDGIDGELKRIEERIGSVSYHILAWTENADAISLINTRLNAMLEDGTLNEMRKEYGLEYTEK